MAGTPEISLMTFMIGQMARHYGVPWRPPNTLGGAKTLDAHDMSVCACAWFSITRQALVFVGVFVGVFVTRACLPVCVCVALSHMTIAE